MNQRIDVVATTMSGSIADWNKVEQIGPLFLKHGETRVTVRTADSHLEARAISKALVLDGCRILISAGGSGTFNAVLEGCCDSGVALNEIQLGFLRKGSADLIGKVLKIPDEIELMIPLFVGAIRDNRVVPCDVLRVVSDRTDLRPRHFVGYGGAELFGEIPRFTENRFIKYYKGVLGQLFGDLGPFFVGTSLALTARLVRRLYRRAWSWSITVDGAEVAEGRYQSLIIVNGDLGPDLPYARNKPLGLGEFYLFAVRDIGLLKLPRQLKAGWTAAILDEPKRYGLEAFTINDKLNLRPGYDGVYPVNVDGSTLPCRGTTEITISDRINLLTGAQTEG